MITRDRNIDPASFTARHTDQIGVVTAVSKKDRPFAVYKAPTALRVVAASVYCQAYTAVAAIHLFNSSGSDVVSGSPLAIDATPEKFKTTAAILSSLAGQFYEKAAATAIVFSAAHVITALKWGVVLVQLTPGSGAVSTKVPVATPTTAMTYATSAEALAALAGMSADAGKLKIGHILIHNNAGDWTANTDDLTDGSDITAATFSDGTAYELPEITSITPVALKEVQGVIATTHDCHRVKEDRYIVATFETDGAGAMTGGQFKLTTRADFMRGDALASDSTYR